MGPSRWGEGSVANNQAQSGKGGSYLLQIARAVDLFQATPTEVIRMSAGWGCEGIKL
jgi:hypothetical protein